MRPEPEGRPLSRSIQGPEGPCSLRHGPASIKPCVGPERNAKLRRPARRPIPAPPGPDRNGGSVGLQPHEMLPARFSRNRVRGEAAPKSSRPPQSRVAPSFAFFQRRVGNHNHHTEGAWGFSPTKSRPPVFREIKCAAKPRPNSSIQQSSPSHNPGCPVVSLLRPGIARTIAPQFCIRAWLEPSRKPPTIFREIRYAAKPRPNLAAAPPALIE